MLMLGLIGCDGKPPAPGAPPPAGVTVAYPVQRDVIEWDVFTGHLEAPRSVNVVARVSGLVEQMPFAEGSIVKKGDVLAVIDDRPFKADLEQKIADKKKSESGAAIAKSTLDRYVGVRSTNAVSQQDVDNAQSNYDQALAAVASSQAGIDIAKLNLEWCKVLSPVDGRVSDKMVTEGNFVNGGAGQATMLTTVQSVSPIYCYVDIDENSVLKYQKLASAGKMTSTRDGKVPCYVQLGNETDFPHGGTIDFVDNRVNPATGIERIRGVLNNESGLLTPGFFARLSIPGSGKYSTLLVPDIAVGSDQSHRILMVVGKEDKVEPHIVELGALFGTMRAIKSGVTAEDRVIVKGLMSARPGAVVKPAEEPVKFDEAALTSPGGAAPSSMMPSSDAPSSAAPSSTVPSSTVPPSTVPSSTAPSSKAESNRE